MTYCPRCSRDVHPMEDEHVLLVLNSLVENIKLRPHMEGSETDKACCIITAYIRGRERRYWEVK